MVNSGAAIVKHRTRFLLFFFFFFLLFLRVFFLRKKCCCSIHVVLLALQMSLLTCLSTVRISQDKMHLCLSEAYGRAEPVACRSEWMAPLKLWLRFDDLVDHFEVFAVHMEERGCLPAYFLFFLLK